MEPLFLSHREVCEMTGAGTKAGQVRVLVKNGIRHTIKANGWPCVARAAILGTQEKHEKPAWQPRKAG
ncbi:protein of unknown function [Pseudomonas linyingensis]|uniref:DUF4224 domain-containing protein n=1 Tax=Pseudomonas linyingensis TaxID=915471 RepID=A0A1H7A6T7_9PSED|nr:DUF4224 domain-containing protein [Pseudomonas linyingensis]SEJ56755.1 protein of unknown function [Pseudomonas linyingensis]